MLKPQISSSREAVRLDGLWSFVLDDPAVPTPWTHRWRGARDVPVPASYNDIFADPTIRDHVGWVWYQRTVRVPRGWGDQRTVIRLDAATHEGVVYVGDSKVASHRGGYLPCEVDVTEFVVAGEEFLLTVGVNNVLTNETIPPGEVRERADGTRQQTYQHDFYNYAGLHRSVWLYSTPPCHVEDVTVVTRRDGATGLVDYDVTVAGEADVTVTLRDEQGEVVATHAGHQGTLHVADAVLWNPGAAYLYDLEVRAAGADGSTDTYSLAVGIRTVEVKGGAFLINDVPFYFTGFGKHEDAPVLGKAHSDAFMVHDFELMGWTGANSFRTSHYPYAEEVLDYADRHGWVVIDETAAVGLNKRIGGGVHRTLDGREPRFLDSFGPGLQDAHRQEITELVARDKNHPSVVMWSIANEPDSVSLGADEYFAPLFALTRELDPTRPVTFVNEVMGTPEGCAVSQFADVLCLNRYYGWYIDAGDITQAEKGLEAELREWARHGKPIVITEYGADAMAGLHSIWDQPWTEEFQANLLATYHEVFDRIPEVVGEQVWNFADFQTSRGFFRVDGNKKGAFTRDRRPKAAAHALRQRWQSRRDGNPLQ